MPDTEFRIDYVIKRREGEGDFTEIGFGTSGTWSRLDPALYAVQSDVQNRQWETEPGHPDPSVVDVGEES